VDSVAGALYQGTTSVVPKRVALMSCHHEEAQGSLATERDRGICFSLEDFFRESEKQIPRGLKPARNDNFHKIWDVNRAKHAPGVHDRPGPG